jgi:tetratricopeptide (TPR) repeat protein
LIRIRRLSTPIICLLAINLFPLFSAQAETSIRSEHALSIAQSIWSGDFDSVLNECQQLIAREPANPVGFFLTGLTYYSINSQYRNDLFADSVTFYLGAAISLAQKTDHGENIQAENYFIIGSSYGCLALFKSNHGGWWGAFRDGRRSCSNLEKAYAMDTTLTDALGGIGAYHYWKSAKTKMLAWLPFTSDKRKQGIAEILLSITSGKIMAASAQKSLLAVYFDEGQYDKVLSMGNSLDVANLLDPNSRLHVARALIELQRWDDAESMLGEIQSIWGKSNYYDPGGASEVLLLRSRILLARGDPSGAEQILQQILSMDDTCRANAFYKQTLTKAKALSH